MRQPIIDPEKVDSWTQSMRAAFSSGPGTLGMWIALAVVLIALTIVVAAAWRSSRPQPDPMLDLQRLVEAKPGPKATLDRAHARH